ncbi:hypothetical protein [Sulfurimonas sp.]
MKKFNLFNEIIIVDKKELLNAVNSTKTFAINEQGEVKQPPYDDKEILIFEGKHTPQKVSALMQQAAPTLNHIFGKNYQIVEDDDRVLIKAFSNWQELIKLNVPRASYDDSTGDGVSEFSNTKLEDIGWNATEFNVSYREMVEFLEESCEGVLLCIEQEEPYQFSGLGFLKNEENAYKELFTFCKNKAKKLMDEDPLYAKDKLSDDEKEAAEFFGLV